MSIGLLRPEVDSMNGFRVHYRLCPGSELAAKPLKFGFATLFPPMGRSTDKVTGLKVHDARGDLQLTEGASENGLQVWTTDRVPAGDVEVDYDLPVAVEKPAFRGPLFEPQAAKNGVVSSGRGFLVLPENSKPFHIHLGWKLPKGMSGISSFGVGDVKFNATAQTLGDSIYLAGTPYRFGNSTPMHGFSVQGIGSPGYDLEDVFAWERRWYDASVKYFHGSPRDAFRVFFLANAGGAGQTGITLNHGFLFYAPPQMPYGGVLAWKRLLAHETIHVWIPALNDDKGFAGWYSEGGADYFSTVLPYRQGLYSSREYLHTINMLTAHYYGGRYWATPNDRLDSVIWSEPQAWTTHYARGFIYLASLNAKLLKRSHGRIGVLEVINEIVARQRGGEQADLATWENAIRRHGGPEAVRDYHDMLAGRLIMVEPDAFGACFTPHRTQVGAFQPGFAAQRNGRGANIVRTVEAGSNAQKAGLRPGDEITAPVDWNTSFDDPTQEMILSIRRDGLTQTITFLPRTGSTPSVIWTPRSGDPDAPCHKRKL